MVDFFTNTVSIAVNVGKNVVNKNYKERVTNTNIHAKNAQIKNSNVLPGVNLLKCAHVNLQKINYKLKEILGKLFTYAKKLGITLVVGDGWRSHEYQKKAKQAKPELAAPAYTSAHEYGAAVDLCYIDKNGKLNNDFRKLPKLVQYAKRLGLDWGLEVCGKKDSEYWHFQLRNWQSQPGIKEEYNKDSQYRNW